MKAYVPIDCNYYDELEALATKREFIEIKYRNEQGAIASTQSVIVDFFIENKVEFLRLKNGQSIRLDLLVSVDGRYPPNGGTCKV